MRTNIPEKLLKITDAGSPFHNRRFTISRISYGNLALLDHC